MKSSKIFSCTNLRLNIAQLIVCAATSLAGCSQSIDESIDDATPAEAALAKPRDVRAKLHLIQTPDARMLWAELNARIYPLRCDSPIGLANLVRGLGFSAWDVPTENEMLTLGAARAKFGPDAEYRQALTCPSNATLYFVNRNGRKDYYVDFNQDEDNQSIVHMIGCTSLIEALGLNEHDAIEISQTILDEFTVSGDENDINCRNDTGVLLHPAVYGSASLFATRAQDSSSTAYYLYNGSRGFRLTCASPSGMRELISGVGFPMELMPLLMPVGETDPLVQEALQNSVDVNLDCDMSDSRLLAITDNGSDTYWVESPKNTKIFHRIGCRELAHAMGLSDLSRAERVTKRVALNLLHAQLSNADEFACAASNEPL